MVETATPARTSRSSSSRNGVIRPADQKSQPQSSEGSEHGTLGRIQLSCAAHRQYYSGPKSSAGRDAHQKGIRQRVAQSALHGDPCQGKSPSGEQGKHSTGKTDFTDDEEQRIIRQRPLLPGDSHSLGQSSQYLGGSCSLRGRTAGQRNGKHPAQTKQH